MGIQGTIIKSLAGVVLDSDTAGISFHLNEISEILHRDWGGGSCIKSEDFRFLSVLDLPDITLVATEAGEINRPLFRDPEITITVCKVRLYKNIYGCSLEEITLNDFKGLGYRTILSRIKCKSIGGKIYAISVKSDCDIHGIRAGLIVNNREVSRIVQWRTT